MRGPILSRLCALLFLALLWPASARASDLVQLSLEEQGDHVVLELTGVTIAHGTEVKSRGDRLEVVLLSAVGDFDVAIKDDTVKSVRVYSTSRLRVFVQLRHGRRNTELTAEGSAVKATDGGIKITLPRDPIVKEANVTAPVQLAASLAVPKASTPPASAVPQPMPQALAPNDQTAGVAKVAPSGEENGHGGGGGWMVFVLTFLAACAGLVFYMKRKRGFDSELGASLYVVASKSLGPKTRVVWLSTGDRQLVIGLGDNGPSLLTQWASSEDTEQSEDLDEVDEVDASPYVSATFELPPEEDERVEPLFGTLTPPDLFRKPAASIPPPPPASPAVAGILSLRAKLNPVSDHVATESEKDDEEWARDLELAARMHGSVVR